MEQTAVEWLVEKITLKKLDNETYLIPRISNEDIEQAKQMEKQQIIDFAVWFNNRDNTYKSYTQIVEQYYNETFKNK